MNFFSKIKNWKKLLLWISSLVTLSSIVPFIASCTIVFKPVDTSKDKLDDEDEEGTNEEGDIVIDANSEGDNKPTSTSN